MFFICSLCVSVKRRAPVAASAASIQAVLGIAHFVFGNGMRNQRFLVDGTRHVRRRAQ
jgi:hypothetical protein